MKTILFYLLIVIGINSYAQTTAWNDLFSYSNISDVIKTSNTIYAASENGLISYEANTGEIKTLSKINGLNNVGISALAYIPNQDGLIVGYNNGELDLVYQDEIVNITEIPLNQTITTTRKINHILVEDNNAYITADFGIVTFDLVEQEFRDTIYFNVSGTTIKAFESTIYNNHIFTTTESGLFTHELNTSYIDFSSWTNITDITGNINSITSYENNLYAGVNNQLYQYNGTNWTSIQTYSNNIKKLYNQNQKLIVVLSEKIIAYDTGLNQTNEINSPENSILTSCYLEDSQAYLGTNSNGLFKENSNSTESITPEGPKRNDPFKIAARENHVYIVYGGYNTSSGPTNTSLKYFNHFNGNEWYLTEYEGSIEVGSLSSIAIDPSNPNHAYIGSYNKGLLEYENNSVIQHYTSQNSTLQITGSYNGFWTTRIGGLTFDKEGALWASNSPLSTTVFSKKSTNENWTSADIASVLAGSSDYDFYELESDNNNNLYLASRKLGIIVYNSESGLLKSIGTNPNKGNIPSGRALTSALDQDGNLWIGTESGLTVLYNANSILQNNTYTAQQVILADENGDGALLLGEEQINSIEIDGANEKWIGTANGGVVHTTADGKNIIHQFTISNSPLPSNNVLDIEVDLTTGIVYMATDKGLVSFNSRNTEGANNFDNVYAYPNPVRPENNSVSLTGLMNDSTIKITDVSGNLLKEGTSNGGTFQWDLKNLNGKKVASGVYIVWITNSDGSEDKATKIAVIR